jgi:hypothetical protein
MLDFKFGRFLRLNTKTSEKVIIKEKEIENDG